MPKGKRTNHRNFQLGSPTQINWTALISQVHLPAHLPARSFCILHSSFSISLTHTETHQNKVKQSETHQNKPKGVPRPISPTSDFRPLSSAPAAPISQPLARSASPFQPLPPGYPGLRLYPEFRLGRPWTLAFGLLAIVLERTGAPASPSAIAYRNQLSLWSFPHCSKLR